MLGARELGLGDDHDGILPLVADAELGADVRDVLGLHEVVFDLSITPNRSDAMSIAGVARDLAAHFGLPFALPEPSVDVSGDADDITVVVDAPDRAPRFTARRVGVTMGPSPEWMQRRLTLAGMRPISNVVDVTNYVMLERGQPSHAFDLDRLRGPGLVVRLAAEGETLTTLDDVERTLLPSDLLICDADRRPQAIAGIMGGAEAEVHDGTTGIVLEVAYFAPMGDLDDVEALGLRSEASAALRAGCRPERCAAGVGPGRRAAHRGRGRAGRSARDRRVPVAGRADAYPRPPGACRGGPRARPHPCAGGGRAGARSASTSRTPATPTRSSPSRPRSAPTSSARSTSSRRSAAASGSTRSRARCRTPRSSVVG